MTKFTKNSRFLEKNMIFVKHPMIVDNHTFFQ